MKGSIWDACTRETDYSVEDPRDQAFRQAGVLWTQVRLAVFHDAFSLARAIFRLRYLSISCLCNCFPGV